MKHVPHAFLFAMVLVLSACASLGIPPADTFNKRLQVGYTTIETVADSTTLLLQTGKLSRSDGENVLEQATNAKASLDIARSIHETSPELGDSKLSATLLVLQTLQVYVGGVK